MSKYNIAFLFPLHNEEKRVYQTLKFIRFAKKNFKKCVFVFLLNGCNDNTEQVVNDKIKKLHKNTIILKNSSHKRGVGLNSAYRKVDTNYFAVCSVDNAWGFDFYKKSYDILKKNKSEIVYGPKNHKKSKVSRPVIRELISFLSKIFLRIVFPEKPNIDTQCIKVFKANIEIISHLHSYNYFSETEFAIMANIRKVRYTTLPVVVKNTKNSKVNFFKLFEYIYESIHFRIYLLTITYAKAF